MARTDLGKRQHDRRLAEFGEDQLAAPGLGIDRHQHAGLALGKQQHRGQQRRLDARKRLAHDPAREPGAARGALEERRRQPATLERQAREHGIRRERTAMRPGDHEQAVEQRVDTTRGDTLRMRGRLPSPTSTTVSARPTQAPRSSAQECDSNYMLRRGMGRADHPRVLHHTGAFTWAGGSSYSHFL